MNNAPALISAVFLAAYGARLLLRTRQQLTASQADHQRLVDNRITRGEDAYADELRALNAYRPNPSIWQRRLLGVLLLILSLGFIALTLFVPE
jgi:hypothetical protein